MSDQEPELVCDLCREKIQEEQPHTILCVESHQKIDDEIVVLGGERSAVFASFHSECILSTMDNEECDEVPYIWEVRTFMGESDLCTDCEEKLPEYEDEDDDTTKPDDRRRGHLSLIKGGVE